MGRGRGVPAQSATIKMLPLYEYTALTLLCRLLFLQLEDFIKDWDENGPGSVGPDLEHGVRLMDPYSHKIEKRELRRQELANAERLFDMPMVDYNEFGRVQAEFEGLQQVLYKSI